MTEFFTTDFIAEAYDHSLSQSPQGQLSSAYVAALTQALMEADAADFVGFLSYVQALNSGADDLSALAQALAVKALVEAGDFTLSDLFGSAQTKDGSLVGSIDPANPTPTLTVMIGETTVSVDLTAMMDGLDTEFWTQEQVAKKITQTIYHIREFFTGITEPEGYDSGWSSSPEEGNHAPTADPIVVEYTETQKQGGGGFSVDPNWTATADYASIDLLAADHVYDQDDDPLSVVDGSVMLSDGGALPGYITYANGVLTVDRNSPLLDDLLQGQERAITITYQITDGEATIDNTVQITLTGTADLFHDGVLSASEVFRGTEPGGPTPANPNTFSFDLGAPEDAFNFIGTAAVSVSGDIDRNFEVISVTLEGGAPRNFSLGNGGANNESTTTTVTHDMGFQSADDLITGSFGATDQVNGVVTIDVSATYDYWA